MSDDLPQDASEIGTLVKLVLCCFKCPESTLVSKIIRQATKTIKSEKVQTCLLPVGSEESRHSILIKWGQKALKFHSCFHGSSQLQNMTTQLLRPLAIFTASDWEGMRSRHFIHHFDGHTNEIKLLSFSHS